MVALMAELEQREQRAQAGLDQLALKARDIRDRKEYPNSNRRGAWAEYCQSQFGFTAAAMERLIRDALHRADLLATEEEK